MKKPLFLLLLAATLITACKKDNSSTPTPSTSTTLLTKITNNISGDPAYGKSFIEFSYNGKQLTKEVRYEYNKDGSVNNAQTTTFNYDSKANLTGTTISNSNPSRYVDYVSSTITATGNTISEIKLYAPNNVVADDIVFTYKDGKLSGSTSPLSGAVTYTYDANGNNTTGYGYGNEINKLFDSKNNLSGALPYWVYFAYIQFPDGYYQGVPLYPGTHNVLSFDHDNGANTTYSYQYNGFDYPSVSTSTVKDSNGHILSYTYQYTQVN
ncbi:MAG TPA: hypothetical protein VNW51_00085 [Mucilaginibacter sp.]|jgi:YD repeat-containing protein|nr:hypothetical protein [Mucilaginibacter sp.]